MRKVLISEEGCVTFGGDGASSTTIPDGNSDMKAEIAVSVRPFVVTERSAQATAFCNVSDTHNEVNHNHVTSAHEGDRSCVTTDRP